MADPNSTKISSSGITTDAVTGERYIPSSIRADGSKRREIRVRPGYRPPEDVELYKNRAAEAWKNRGKGGVPGAEGLSPSEEGGGGGSGGTAASNKNAKRREARKKAKAEEEKSSEQQKPPPPPQQQTPTERRAETATNWRSTEGHNNQQAEPAAVDPEVEKEKKARNLKKKLRQARELREKKDSGEALLPEQLEKVIKINELVRQLDSLGFDSNGEKKV
ncbi:hypothetical protein ASPZODRAFT_134041 [Penicilliopsis zonata CBS 506.65]|uniref:WIBG Mago-binding domain-containing protein n=1 Tax=Penicilliopsis zonata CBS 506.65 TaxID=1073090 RepID=A0A1L9SE52_9EURO|nr:hypothetical protein ASPZODRAFT_134041 [Penicilliopsis zonata CBS 506.65]OJJ45393.1 hypothetical protein ASPZODRAFT_134041 [Penicilliopsis zonata CBS 506.65]